MRNSIFIGLNERALNILQLEGKPAVRQTKIIYADGTEKIISEHPFVEIEYEKDGEFLIWRKNGKVVLEEKPQEPFDSRYIFTALWSVESDNWVPDSLWTEAERLSYE
jgi:hypothetical protein